MFQYYESKGCVVEKLSEVMDARCDGRNTTPAL